MDYNTLLFVVELALVTRPGEKETKLNIMNFDQVDSFTKTYAPEPEKK